MKHLAIFASGGGSNARKIIEYFEKKPAVRVSLLISNKKDAPALEMAGSFGIATHVINRKEFYETENLLEILQQYKIDFIALAGFLWLIPPYLVRAYPRRMTNIHPALLPKYGGKGMYGWHVHEAVRAAGETESGMTIHYVNENYDEGDIIFQARCPIDPDDTPQDIAAKVLKLEHRYYPEVLDKVISEE